MGGLEDSGMLGGCGSGGHPLIRSGGNPLISSVGHPWGSSRAHPCSCGWCGSLGWGHPWSCGRFGYLSWGQFVLVGPKLLGGDQGG